MKTPEEYLREFEDIPNKLCPDMYIREDILDFIRQAQIEAIDYTVKRCAEEAKAGYIAPKGDLDNIEILVDKQSILNVADKIKEELYGSGNRE